MTVKIINENFNVKLDPNDRLVVNSLNRGSKKNELGKIYDEDGCLVRYGIEISANGKLFRVGVNLFKSFHLGHTPRRTHSQLAWEGFKKQKSIVREDGKSWKPDIVAGNVLAHEILYHAVANHLGFLGLGAHSNSSENTSDIDHDGLTWDLILKTGGMSENLIKDLKDELEFK